MCEKKPWFDEAGIGAAKELEPWLKRGWWRVETGFKGGLEFDEACANSGFLDSKINFK